MKRRFLPSLHNFFGLYLPLADKAVLYNSTLHPPKLVAHGGKENSSSTHLAIMNPSAPADHQPDAHDRFFEEAQAAMLRASRQVTAENRRLGLPLIVERPRHKRPARKRLVKGAALLQF
ncbi:MAG: hypothetical protein NTV93_04520 [Verrucomicrobia bacterium]|nr:hypothetical protein [Verrucomicrobiota bacterium]